MSLAERLIDYVHAAFTGIWVQTQEPDEAQREILRLAQERRWKAAVWDVAQGLRIPGSTAASDAGAGDPLAALRAMPALGDGDQPALLLVHQFHRFLTSPEILQTAFTQLLAGKQRRTFLIVLASVVQIPLELEKLFVVIEHALPDRPQLEAIARELGSDRDFPDGPHLDRILEAAAGLTRYEAEGAFALSLARHGTLRPDVLWELKSQGLKRDRLLTLHRGQERFSSLGGLAHLKDFCMRALQPGKAIKPRGVLVLGVPGCGKSMFAKALGAETGRPTLLLDFGSLYGSLVGSTEANVRRALSIVDAMAPCILFTDELEKGLSGVGGQGDSGVSTRLFGTLLTWLAEHESDVFFIGTANDISKLPAEFTRAERLDGVFFLDLPGPADRELIWRMYRRQYAIPDEQHKPDDGGWTGAEIKSCCRLAALLDVPLTQAARNVVPVAITAAESVEKLRTWASGRCLSASGPGIYHRDGEPPARPARRVQRPTNN